MQHDPRRTSPRIDIEAICWEVVGDKEMSSLVIDISSEGARLERPYTGGRIEREVPLQLEVPGIDEVMWARGDVVFDRLVPIKTDADIITHGGPFGLMRTTGYRIAVAAARDLRMLRDYVYEMYRARRAAEHVELEMASCYMRG